jgi:hypothetical protein
MTDKLVKSGDCFFCNQKATHYDVIVDHSDYVIADVCLDHLSMGLVS